MAAARCHMFPCWIFRRQRRWSEQQRFSPRPRNQNQDSGLQDQVRTRAILWSSPISWERTRVIPCMPSRLFATCPIGSVLWRDLQDPQAWRSGESCPAYVLCYSGLMLSLKFGVCGRCTTDEWQPFTVPAHLRTEPVDWLQPITSRDELAHALPDFPGRPTPPSIPTAP